MKRLITLLVIVAILVGAFFGWRAFRRARQGKSASKNYQTTIAALGNLTATVGATGTVRANQTASLTWQTSGRVEDILVQVGDRVQAGQVLASLASDSLSPSVILAQADRINAQKSLDALNDTLLAQAQAEQAVERAQQALDDLTANNLLAQAQAQQAATNAQTAVASAEQHLGDLTGEAHQKDLEAAKASLVLAQDKLDKAQKSFDPYKNRAEDDYTRAFYQARLSDAQRQYDAAVSALAALQGTTYENNLAQAQASLHLAQAQLADAQQNWETLKAGPSAIDRALLEAQLSDAQSKLADLQAGPDPNDIAALQARMDAAQATLDQTSIRAPFAGTITDIKNSTGDQVTPGKAAFRLDDLSRLLVDVSLSEVDINRIAVGQSVSITFDAISGKEYRGIVNEVASVGDVTSQGAASFVVTVELTNADDDIKPGMTAAVNIIIEQLQDVLLVPNRAVRIFDGERAVYILVDGQGGWVQVTLGVSSGVESQVLAGDLRLGDVVVLNPPVVLDPSFRPAFLRR